MKIISKLFFWGVIGALPLYAQQSFDVNAGYHRIYYDINPVLVEKLVSGDQIRNTSDGIIAELRYQKNYDNNIISIQTGIRFETLIWEKFFDNVIDPSIPDKVSHKLLRRNFYAGIGYGRKIFGSRKHSYFFASLNTAFHLGLMEQKMSPFQTHSPVQKYGWSLGANLGYRYKLNKKVLRPGFFLLSQVNPMRTYYFTDKKMVRATLGITAGLGYAF